MDDPPNPVVDAFECDLLEVDREILAILAAEQTRTTGYLDKHTSDRYSRSWISQRLQILRENGPLERVDHGLYELELHSPLTDRPHPPDTHATE